MTHRHQARAALLTALLLITSLPILPAAAEAEGACCEMDEFNLFLTGEAENGGLTPFEADLEDEFETFVTPSVQGLVEIGTWSVVWGLQGNYPDATWEFRIPFEVEAAAGIQINATIGVHIGGTYFEGDAGAGLFLTSNGEVVIPVNVEAGEILESESVEISFSVRSLSFSSPGDDAGIRFIWGSTDYPAKISMKFPLVEIDMKEASVKGRLVFFPIVLKSGFADRMWSASTGGMSVANTAISDRPIATPVNDGVEVTFVWEIPESTDSGNFRTDFHLIPQTSLRIEAYRTHDITAGEDGGGSGGWYPAAEPLRSGGSALNVDIDASFDGDSVERVVIIEIDGAMSQWMRWGLDNIGNDSLSSNSWWRNLRTYADSIPSSDFHNGRVDDSELLALQGHLIGSASDMKSFLANGLSIDAEALFGVNPIDLGPMDINIDLGHTRAFSSEAITLTFDTSNSVAEGQRQQLIESFVRKTQDDYYNDVSLHVEIRSNALQGLGGVAAEDIDVKHRRWILMEMITVDESDLDPDKSFRVEFVPTGGALYSPLVSAMVSVFMLCIALALGLFLTRKREKVPAMLTVVVLGGLSLALYVLGLDMPFVLGVVASSILLVFPVALVSPRSDSKKLPRSRHGGARVDCPKCGESIRVDSDVRPLRLPCEGCDSILRLE